MLEELFENVNWLLFVIVFGICLISTLVSSWGIVHKIIIIVFAAVFTMLIAKNK